MYYIYMCVCGGFSTLCHSCGYFCQQRELKMFPGPGYICYDGCLNMAFLGQLIYIYIYIYIYI